MVGDGVDSTTYTSSSLAVGIPHILEMTADEANDRSYIALNGQYLEGPGNLWVNGNLGAFILNNYTPSDPQNSWQYIWSAIWSISQPD